MPVAPCVSVKASRWKNTWENRALDKCKGHPVSLSTGRTRVSMCWSKFGFRAGLQRSSHSGYLSRMRGQKCQHREVRLVVYQEFIQETSEKDRNGGLWPEFDLEGGLEFSPLMTAGISKLWRIAEL